MGADGEPKDGHTFEQKSYYILRSAKQPQFTCQANTVIDSSLTTVHSIVDCHEFIGSQE